MPVTASITSALAVTADNGKTILIPVIDQCILDHNLEEKTVTVHMLPGLMDLN